MWKFRGSDAQPVTHLVLGESEPRRKMPGMHAPLPPFAILVLTDSRN